MPKSLEIKAGSEEELCSLYMTYINPEVDYYGKGHKEEDVCSVRNEVFRFDKKYNSDQIEKILSRFNKYSEEQCLQIGKQYYDNYKDFGATSWYPDYVDQAAEFSNHVWKNDKYVEDFQIEDHNQLIMLC